MAFVVSANVMEVKLLSFRVFFLVLSLCIEYFLGAVLKLLLGSLVLVVKHLCLLCIEELKHVELFTYPKVVSCVLTLHVFPGVNLYDELDGPAIIQHVVLDQVSAVRVLTFGVHDFFVLFQVMEVIGSPTCLVCVETEQCVFIINAH